MTAVYWDMCWVALKVERWAVRKDAMKAVRLAAHWAAHSELQKAVLTAGVKVASMVESSGQHSVALKAVTMVVR